MEHSVQSRRREERVPLDALVELRTDDSGEVLEADGLDLSPGGLSMRAAFVPPVGARLQCQFRCAPDGERVRAEGEVVWANWSSGHDGSFGLRFLALDTKSATAIRRHVEPEAPLSRVSPAAKGPVQMRIDGLGAPIEADVLFADSGSLVLEQDLTFLKLGRGVAVELPGRGLKRGRIGSVELRQGPLDVPTLVFGILLDVEPSDAHEPALGRVAAQRSASRPVRAAQLDAQALPASGADESAGSVLPAEAKSTEAAPPLASTEVEQPCAHDSDSVAQQAHARGPSALQAYEDVGEPEEVALAARVELSVEEPTPTRLSNANVRKVQESGPVGEAAVATSAEAAELEGPEKVWQLERAVPAMREACRAWLEEWLPAARERLHAVRVALQAWFARSLAVRGWLGEQLAILREWCAAQRGRIAAFRRLRRAKSRATAPAPRVQRTQRGTGRAAPRVVKPRYQRFMALILAAGGVGLGVYALAPRSGADRIRIHTVVAPTPQEEVLAAPAPTLAEPAAAEAPAASPAEGPSPSEAVKAAPSVPEPLRFGEENVPNGRTFSLRMSGPVESLEGEPRDDGFTVKVPGRLALDKASPIASSHRAVQRAMILNRGDYAELTIDFVPGLRPKYQVLAKDAALEVTLERL